MPKAPPVRPRSKLSVRDDQLHHNHHKATHRGRRRPNNTILTLAGFCVFLFVLCAFLLGALVYVGRNIVSDTTSNLKTNLNLTDANGRYAFAIPSGQWEHMEQSEHSEQFVPNIKNSPILRFLTNSTIHSTVPTIQKRLTPTVSPEVMSASKVIQQLSYRLPKELRPRRYNLRMQPDLVNNTFQGNVTIQVEVLKPISFIPVHAKFLNVSTKEVMRLSENLTALEKVVPSLTFEYAEYEYWVTEFAEQLQAGNYSLELSFNGSLANHTVGFYQSSYLDKIQNKRRWIATSKFEPTYARQAFPCFDEPAMKAMFTVTVVRPSGDGYHALSNMNVQNENVLGDITEVEFAESVPMSTYLVCFIVSDFASQGKTVSGVLEGVSDFEMRVFSTSGQVNKVAYALETGVGITEYYINYFNVSYPLPKLDMAAIPDFVSGAMEHWGLVTFRETALLYDESISSSANKQRVATVIAHELAHMWFGNLVTMKWWNDLWLNEGFASYIEYKGVNHVHPEWNMLDQFLISDLHGVLKIDATLAAHPIVQTVESPSQITELFDTITYSKGASLIRMLEDLVGAEKFSEATTKYIYRFYYNNANTDDFLSAIEEFEFDFDVKLIMQTWTEQMGLPVVEVTQNGNTYKLTQKRFFSNPADYDGTYDDSQFNYRWSIPITYYTSASAEKERLIFNYNDNEATVTVSSAVDWIKFNNDQVGYYRINYPTEMWQSLATALKNNRGEFSVADRAHLLNDVFALADASQLAYSIALDLSAYLEKERDYVPWSVGASQLNTIKNLLYYTDLYRDFVVYGRNLVSQAYESLGWNVDTDHLMNLLRVSILNLACGFGHETALEEAATRFSSWLDNPEVRPSPDVRITVYYYGMQESGNEKLWNQVWTLFLAEQDAQEKVKLMQSLAAINEPWILQRYINLAWNENNVRGQDYFTCLQYISQNRIGQSLVWDYVRENWEKLVDRFGINERYLGRLIPSITARFTTQTKLEEMEAFFAKYPEAGAGTAARKEALETVKNNIKWLEQNKQLIDDWLSAQNGSGDGLKNNLKK